MDNCDNCTTCECSVFDELWGEYKCKFFDHRIYILLDTSECPEYTKKKGDNSK
jgi:hypothetical protein